MPCGQQQPRYDRTSKVTGLEADEARALHVIADLLDDYSGIDAPIIVSRLGEILRSTPIQSTPAATCPSGSAEAVRHLADAVRVEMQQPGDPGRR